MANAKEQVVAGVSDAKLKASESEEDRVRGRMFKQAFDAASPEQQQKMLELIMVKPEAEQSTA